MINGKVKGGFTVDINTIRAFLPHSLLDGELVPDTRHLEFKEHTFKVIKIDRTRNDLVVSRRAVLELADGTEHKQPPNTLQEGMIVKGTVKRQ